LLEQISGSKKWLKNRVSHVVLYV